MYISKYFRYLSTIIKLKIYRVKFHYKVSGNNFYINNKGTIILDENVYLHSFPDGSSFRTALSTYYPEAKITIGKNSSLNGTVIHCNEKVAIGENCLFGPGVIICDNNSHNVVINTIERRKKPKSAPITFEDNVWVGMNTLILKGVNIGKNSIIAANSVVLKDIKSNSLYGGNPARFIRSIY